MVKRPKPIVLTVLDGWGYRAESKGNAIALARKPTYDELLRKFPNTLIQTSGPFVGLPEGQMGNSEVGHMNMGAGRIVHMDITRIDLMIANKQFELVPLFRQAMERGRQRQLHFLGLLSDGGVHSHIHHLFALLEMAKQQKVHSVFVHCFMDGRDTPPNSGRDYVRQLQQKMRELGRSLRSWVATTRWTATTVGSVWKWRIARWCMVKRRRKPAIRWRPSSGATNRA